MQNNPKILLIIPAYNEEFNILNTVESVKKSKTKVDVVVINDGSTDNTAKILEENHITHINLIKNLGIGGAVQTGYKYAYENQYDIAIQFDGDGQHDANYIDTLVKPIIEDHIDFVIGSRFISEHESEFKSTLSRRIGIRIISFFIKLCTGKVAYDVTSGFRAANAKVIKYFSENYPTEFAEPESIVDLIINKFRIMEVPVSMNERQFGLSSIRKWKAIYYMINVSISVIIASLKKASTNHEYNTEN